jgi:hypothetical protein
MADPGKLLHVTLTGWWATPPADGIVGHYLTDDDGNVTPAAAECEDCRAKYAEIASTKRSPDWAPEDDLPF